VLILSRIQRSWNSGFFAPQSNLSDPFKGYAEGLQGNRSAIPDNLRTCSVTFNKHQSEDNVRIIVVGNGGREHALAWKFIQSATVDRVYCIPGNGGTATLPRCENVSLSAEDFAGIGQFATDHQINIVVVGPEVPLALGITDALNAQGITVFGPTKAGAQIEASKTWAKALMAAARVPTAKAQTFTEAVSAITYIKAEGAPIVIKADGLAAGKGVTVAMTEAEAIAAIEEAFQGKFGEAGNCVLIEEYLTGQEVSVLALTDGITIRALVPAQDHKRIGEGDTGPNTGGMGVYAPLPLITPALMSQIQLDVLEPVMQELRSRQIDYRGVLYAGLMITPEGKPQVIEFNCRFGDPETQAILPLLDTPLETLVMACAQQKLKEVGPIAWKPGVSACVVMAAGGYPDAYEKGYPITGLEAAEQLGAVVFHAGTTFRDGQVLTDGGRVLAVNALGQNFDQAFANAYEAIAQIQFQDCYYRHDIGYRVRGSEN
jgi:phosphoribosylamine---glycine ligase